MRSIKGNLVATGRFMKRNTYASATPLDSARKEQNAKVKSIKVDNLTLSKVLEEIGLFCAGGNPVVIVIGDIHGLAHSNVYSYQTIYKNYQQPLKPESNDYL